MNALDLLRQRLHQTFTGALHQAPWGQPDLMSAVLREVSSVFDTTSDAADRRSIGKSLRALRASSRFTSFLDLKYACFGISQATGDDGWVLMEDRRLLDVLLREVGSLAGNPRRLRKCFQGLLAGYFDYNVLDESSREQGRKNWLTLRSFLLSHLPLIEGVTPVLNWVRVISDHHNLLRENPCDRYGKALARSDYSELEPVIRGLAIGRNSWVWEMIVLERIKAVCGFDDSGFKEQLRACLAMMNRGSGIRLSLILQRKCIAHLLRRYARCSSRPESPTLRDHALALLGNPWVERAAWDAHVADQEARTMVDAWLKRRLIMDFFTVLSADGSANMERLKYWLRFIHRIQDMSFALGPWASSHAGEVFREFRDLARDRILALENAPSDEENALIMRIGDFVFVEFSSGEDACLVFRNSEMPLDTDRKWIYFGARCPSGLPRRLSMKRTFRNGRVMVRETP
ncbi:MAG TPA: EH signature domain-containing protein [Deltaproteobacteria bacterium]|nr:EH signature domain-containing protein [Deltaproteobacteria bacterium]